MAAPVRRCTIAAVVVVLMIAVAASQKRTEPPRQVFRITLGLKDQQPTDWSGQVAISGGEVVDIAGWRFEEKDAVDGVNGWRCRTRNYIAPGGHFPLTLANGRRPPTNRR
jgi:hypothetical protein